jgi:hypothetical protein
MKFMVLSMRKSIIKAVELGIGTKIKAHDLWLKIIESQIETGIICI